MYPDDTVIQFLSIVLEIGDKVEFDSIFTKSEVEAIMCDVIDVH